MDTVNAYKLGQTYPLIEELLDLPPVPEEDMSIHGDPSQTTEQPDLHDIAQPPP